jgi:hypothetical protein
VSSIAVSSGVSCSLAPAGGSCDEALCQSRADSVRERDGTRLSDQDLGPILLDAGEDRGRDAVGR